MHQKISLAKQSDVITPSIVLPGQGSPTTADPSVSLPKAWEQIEPAQTSVVEALYTVHYDGFILQQDGSTQVPS